MTDRKVLTFQDISCFGQCSLTVALPIISACGIETVILPSAVLSTHTGGFTGYTFRDLTEDIPGIIKHWQKEGLNFDCLYTGYLGSVEQIDYVLEIRDKVISEGGLLIVDPAMADFGKLYSGFDNEFVLNMARLCKSADIILPNITEAALLTDSEMILDNHEEEYILEMIKKLSSMGAKKIVLKGISYDPSKIGIAIYDSASSELEYYFTNKEPRSSHGTGDCYVAAFTGALMQGQSVFKAASLAADFVAECIRQTASDVKHTYGVRFERALPMLVRELNR